MKITNPALIPPHIARLMSPDDRSSLGIVTPEEAAEKAESREEAAIQSDIAAYLRLHEIEFIRPDMRKKSPLPEGWPDFTFAYLGTPLALEVKTTTGKPTPEQTTMHAKLRRNGWRVEIVRSVADVQRIFREIDALVSARKPASAVTGLP